MKLSKEQIKEKIQAVDSDNHLLSLPKEYGEGLKVSVKTFTHQGAEFEIAYSPKGRVFWAEARMGDKVKEVSAYQVEGLDKIASLESEVIVNLEDLA